VIVFAVYFIRVRSNEVVHPVDALKYAICKVVIALTSSLFNVLGKY
jgi:hypothetical protein